MVLLWSSCSLLSTRPQRPNTSMNGILCTQTCKTFLRTLAHKKGWKCRRKEQKHKGWGKEKVMIGGHQADTLKDSFPLGLLCPSVRNSGRKKKKFGIWLEKVNIAEIAKPISDYRSLYKEIAPNRDDDFAQKMRTVVKCAKRYAFDSKRTITCRNFCVVAPSLVVWLWLENGGGWAWMLDWWSAMSRLSRGYPWTKTPQVFHNLRCFFLNLC